MCLTIAISIREGPFVEITKPSNDQSEISVLATAALLKTGMRIKQIVKVYIDIYTKKEKEREGGWGKRPSLDVVSKKKQQAFK